MVVQRDEARLDERHCEDGEGGAQGVDDEGWGYGGDSLAGLFLGVVGGMGGRRGEVVGGWMDRWDRYYDGFRNL